ncbi:hypothetical protein F5146DRAFT_1005524 [Armillaria mellea]|nr:hypothetical protein F5146DRAFT_1005524 [Armillaria mellea]
MHYLKKTDLKKDNLRQDIRGTVGKVLAFFYLCNGIEVGEYYQAHNCQDPGWAAGFAHSDGPRYFALTSFEHDVIVVHGDERLTTDRRVWNGWKDPGWRGLRGHTGGRGRWGVQCHLQDLQEVYRKPDPCKVYGFYSVNGWVAGVFR